MLDAEDGLIAAERLTDIESGRVNAVSADEVARILAR